MRGRIIDELLSAIKSEVPSLDEICVSRVHIGLSYTGVELNTGDVGVCYTFKDDLSSVCCQIFERAGSLAGCEAERMANLARSWDLSESVVGVATLNALSHGAIEKNREKYVIAEGDLIDNVEIRRDDTVVLVGNLHPFIPRIEEKARRLFILERNPQLRGRGVLPDTASEEILPLADVAIITGTVLANGTIDRLLELSRNAREIGLVGPTASVFPDPLFEHGVTVLGGIRVTDSKRMMQIIAEGGGMPQLKVASKRLVIKPKSPLAK